jgi:hypothetical protein
MSEGGGSTRGRMYDNFTTHIANLLSVAATMHRRRRLSLKNQPDDQPAISHILVATDKDIKTERSSTESSNLLLIASFEKVCSYYYK